VSTTRIHWHDLPAAVRAAIEARTGPVLTAETATEGRNCELAAFVRTAAGWVFVKGLRTSHHGAWTQPVEAMIGPHVRPVAPRLLWHISTGGWDILGFERIHGRHACYAPGSPDLPKVTRAIGQLGRIPCPGLPLKRAEQRWAPYAEDTAALGLLRGDSLLHTDYNPLNVLISGTAHIIDWAWPTRGAAWIDPACLTLRLIAAGHAPRDAETWAAQIPAWHTASAQAIAVFAAASARLWAEIARDDPQPWKQHMSAAARQWLAYRKSPAGPAELAG
jgi:hypothetical protein